MLTYSIRHIDLSDQAFVDEFIASLHKEFFRSDIFEASTSLSIPNHYFSPKIIQINYLLNILQPDYIVILTLVK